MTRTTLAVSATLLCALTFGCKSTSERINSAAEQPAQPSLPGGIDVSENHNVAHTDNAAQVIESCGKPSPDQVLPIYNKMNQGPVRRMVYRKQRLVTLEFSPTHPIARADAHHHLSAQLPAGSTWRFDIAHVPKELDVITAARMELFLPCAAKALRSEF